MADRDRAALATELRDAAFEGDIAAAQRLLDLGLPVDALAPSGETALAAAADGGRLAMVEWLIARGADVALATGSPPLTPLEACCGASGNLEVMRALLAAGADPNRAGAGGLRPLERCLRFAPATAISARLAALLDAGGDPRPPGADGIPLLRVAYARGSEEALGLLAGAVAAAGGDRECLDPRGESLLQRAVRDGRAGAVAALAKAGARTDVADAGGATPLHLAARAGREGVVRALVAADAALDAADRHGATPLLEAVRAGHGTVAEALLRAGLDWTRKDRGFVADEARRLGLTP
jgi:ankyrin repeat protein